MPSPITGKRLGELLSQLCAALGKPFGTKGEKMLPGYLRGLEDWPEEAIEFAIWRACKTWTAKSFPKPAELAALCAQSPHKKLEPEGPKEPVISEVERCRACGEWTAWHRLASLFTGVPALVLKNTIRHRADCPRHRGQEREIHTYRHSWVDSGGPAAVIQRIDVAWKAAGVLQLIYPLPDLPKPPEHRPPSRRLRNPYRQPAPPTPIAGLLSPAPAGASVPPEDAGDAWESGRTESAHG